MFSLTAWMRKRAASAQRNTTTGSIVPDNKWAKLFRPDEEA